MKKSILFSFLIAISTNILCQNNLKKFIIKDKKAKTIETFFLTKDRIKQGNYIFKYKNKVQAVGQYLDNLKDSIWVYSPDKDIKIIGRYKHGLKNDKWVYISKTDTLSILNYENGYRKGKQLGFFENNRVSHEISYNSDGNIDGNEKFYYENGRLQYVISYKNGELHGDKLSYSENGDLLYSLSFVNDIPTNLKISLNQLSNIDYSGNLTNGNGTLNSIDRNNGTILLVRNFKNGLLNGEIIRYNLEGKILFKGEYEKGYMIGKWEFFKLNGEVDRVKHYNRSQELKKDETEFLTQNYENVLLNNLEMPIFDGTDSNSSFRYFISKTLRYPDISAENGSQGKVLVSFEINEVGQVENAKVVKNVEPLLDAEALRVINLSPFWRPGFISGIPIRTSFTFPINFVLQ